MSGDLIASEAMQSRAKKPRSLWIATAGEARLAMTLNQNVSLPPG
jgi:hypothetical protein